MTTNFPSSLDAFTNPTAQDSLNSDTVPHADQHANLNDAVEALQAKVGVDGSAATTSHDYILTNGVLPTLNVDSGVLVVDDSNNRVGVNDASPSYALDVTGDINASGDLRIGGTAVGEWTAYTPTTFGLTIGNGTLTGRYAQVNGLVFFNVSFVMGSTSAVTGDVAFGLPVTRVNTGAGGANGFYADSGTSYNTPAVASMGATTVGFRVMNTGSTYMGVSLISATVPFTWATGDTMSVAGFYEAA